METGDWEYADDCTWLADCEHEPDWSTISVIHDRGVIYIDVKCKLCDAEGHVMQVEDTNDIEW